MPLPYSACIHELYVKPQFGGVYRAIYFPGFSKRCFYAMMKKTPGEGISMITEHQKVFKLDTAHTSYILRITDHGQPEHIYYGRRLPQADVETLCIKNTVTLGSTVDYAPGYCLDSQLLEYSGIGKGDYRHSPLECILPDGSFTTDLVYQSHEILEDAYRSDCGLPFAQGKARTLCLRFADRKYKDLILTLNYTVFADCDVIARNAELHNGTDGTVTVRKFLSAMVDLPEAEYSLLTLNGSWAKEAHIQDAPIGCGIHVNDSTVGASSNRHNPAFLLKRLGADERQGEVIGCNLLYSGNHYSAVERTHQDTLRVAWGISPHCFNWRLGPGECFVTPLAVMSYSGSGINGFAANMHDFVNSHIIPEKFRFVERPVVLNNWEATFFDFNRTKILTMAKQAAALGVEMFVLDDGWFGKRDNDRAGLGDWVVNTKKLPGGLGSLAKAINEMGLRFGLWFEPECVNPDSDLYRAHPDWAIQIPGREPSLGRNQLTLDLTRAEVRDYIVEAVDKILCSANIEYVKWDYNRHMSDVYSASLSDQGEFFHRYILGLYEVLRRIFREKHPDVLLESCSSGGNRFDLGMLCFSPQVWTSDDTDAAERLDIQRGMYCFYPPSAISCHVSMCPNQQTLRTVPLSTRFHVAAFGVLGYELDFGELTPEERRQIRQQIAFYKAHRRVLQFGRFDRYFPKAGQRESWQASGQGEILAAIYNLSYHAIPARDTLRLLQARDGRRYRVESVKRQVRLGQFGGLVKHVLPVKLSADGPVLRFADRHFAMQDGQEVYECSGEALQAGIGLAMQYSGTGYSKALRLQGDWGSTLYVAREVE